MTESIILAKTEAATEHPEIQSMLDELKGFDIQTVEDQETAAEGIQFFKSTWNKFEEKRKRLTVPLNEALREANDVYRPILEASKEGEHILKQKVANHLLAQEQRNRAAITAASVAPTRKEATEALAVVETVEAPKGVSVRQVWKFEVINASLVPYEFLSPDPKKIAAAADDGRDGEPDPIPGVRFFQESIVTARKK